MLYFDNKRFISDCIKNSNAGNVEKNRNPISIRNITMAFRSRNKCLGNILRFHRRNDTKQVAVFGMDKVAGIELDWRTDDFYQVKSAER